jgi:cytochrome P450
MALPPGPRLHPALQTLLYYARPLEFLKWCERNHGSCFTVNTLFFGTEVCVTDPEGIRQIFTADPELVRAGEANALLRPVLGDRSVLLLDGVEHIRQRRLLMPPFHGERMVAYADAMREITERSIASFPREEPFALHTHTQRITLDIILRTVFGMSEGPEHEELRDALGRLLDQTSAVMFSVAVIPKLQRDLGPLTPWAAFQRELRRTDALIYRQIARRRRAKEAGGDRREDVLSMLLDAVDEEGKSMSDKELRDELMTLLAAGHETTATQLCWMFEQLLASPRVKARVEDELSEVTGGGPVRASHIPSLKYLDATVKEVLRLRPVIPGVARFLRAPMTVLGYELPVGTIVAPYITLTHRRPDIYPDPEELRPERFLDKKLDPYAWFPFGGGTRRCLGMAFAMYELKVVTATLLTEVSLKLARRAPGRVTLRGFTHAPEAGTMVVAGRSGRGARAGVSRAAPEPRAAGEAGV